MYDLRPMGWEFDGACSGHPSPEWWFPPKGHRATQAKALCAGCPVRCECLAFAVREHITEGVWGGLLPSERRKVGKAS